MIQKRIQFYFIIALLAVFLSVIVIMKLKPLKSPKKNVAITNNKRINSNSLGIWILYFFSINLGINTNINNKISKDFFVKKDSKKVLAIEVKT